MTKLSLLLALSACLLAPSTSAFATHKKGAAPQANKAWQDSLPSTLPSGIPAIPQDWKDKVPHQVPTGTAALPIDFTNLPPIPSDWIPPWANANAPPSSPSDAPAAPEPSPTDTLPIQQLKAEAAPQAAKKGNAQDGTLYAESPALTNIKAQAAGIVPNATSLNSTNIINEQQNFVRHITITGSVAGVVLIITGLIMTLLGQKLWKPIWFIAGFYVGVLVSFLVLVTIETRMQNGFTGNRDLIYILTCVLTGLLFGGIFLCLIRFALFAVGALLGFVIATIILSFITGGPLHGGIGRGVFIGGMCIVFSIAVAFLERPILIAGTSVVGAYATMLGVDAFAQVGLLAATNAVIKTGQIAGNVNKWLYAELGGFALLAIIGIIVQAVTGKKDHYSSRRQKGYASVEKGAPGMVPVKH